MMDLNKLLKPESIAIVGASENPRIGGMLTKNLYVTQCSKRIYCVNNKGGMIFGKQCYKTISELPEAPDVVFICIPKEFVEDSLREAAQLGTKTAVVCSSGYSEADDEGKEDEIRLSALCRDLDITLLGPNCAGYINGIKNLFAFAIVTDEMTLKPGNVGYISQSGQLVLHLNESKKIKFSYAISVGNCATTEFEDFLDFLVRDEDTKVIALYLEGIKNPKKFVNALQLAHEKNKPVIVLKAGRSQKGQKLAMSHTGSMAGADKAYDAVFNKLGVIRVDDIEELIQTASLFSTLNVLPSKPTYASINFSGGDSAIAADLGEKYKIDFPDFNEETTELLKGSLPFYAAVNNPLDATSTLVTNINAFSEVFEALDRDANIGMILIGFKLPREYYDGPDSIAFVYENMIRLSAKATKPVGLVQFFTAELDPSLQEAFEMVGVNILTSTGYGFQSLGHLSSYINSHMTNKNTRIAVPEVQIDSDSIALSEHASKKLLKEHGFIVPEEVVVSNEEELISACNAIRYPLVLKIESDEILHKSDVGGVFVGIENESEAIEKYHQILKNVNENRPEAKINGVLVQQMLPMGLEFNIGISSDEQFGPMLMCGLGGVYIEIFKDFSLMPVPVNRDDAFVMVNSLKSAALLNGYRGSKRKDVDALVELILKISRFAEKYRDNLAEVDLNPVFVYEEGKGVAIADSLIVFKNKIFL